MIRIDEQGERWLHCDGCVPGYENRFNGVGLATDQQVRRAALDLEGWGRRKFILKVEPFKVAHLDLCPGCNHQNSFVARQILHLVAAEPGPAPETED